MTQLVATFSNKFPDGSEDHSTYADIESALDAVNAPCLKGNGAIWMTLPERIAAKCADDAKTIADLQRVLDQIKSVMQHYSSQG